MEMKRCTKSGVDKAKQREYMKRWQEKHREQERERKRLYRESNLEKERERSRRYYKTHIEQAREQRRLYRETHIGQNREQSRLYRETHREQARERNRRYCETHVEQVREQNRRYRETNPDKCREVVSRWRARKAGVAITLTVKEWQQIKEAYNHRCAYCGKESHRMTQDHIIPLSRGGGHTKDNVVPACGRCNSSKGAGEAPSFQRALLMENP